jgi:flagellar motility protein MotE (MotC chaperone)
MRKFLKIFLLLILVIVIAGGAGYVLMRSGILQAPRFLPSLPVVGKYFAEPEKPQVDPELVNLRRENLELGQIIKNKKAEMEQLQKKYAELEKTLTTTQESEDKLKDDVARLNQEIIDSKNSLAAQKSAYKDMATYFSEMKVKDAADILSRLKDEDIIGILNEMEKDTGAEILQNFERSKAASVTQKMLVTSQNP